MFALLAFCGCTAPQLRTEQPDQETGGPATVTQLSITEQEYVAAEEDAVVVGNEDSRELLRIPANHPTAAAWTQDNTALLYCEQEEFERKEGSAAPEAYVLQQYDLGSNRPEQLFWTRQPMERFVLSARSQFLAYTQGSDLYVFSFASASAARVAEDVQEFAWSPELQALAIVSNNKAEYVTIDHDGAEASRIELADGVLMDGIGFTDRQTLVGFITDDERTRLVRVDLRNGNTEDIDEWRSFSASEDDEQGDEEEKARPQYDFNSFVSQNGSSILVEEIDLNQGGVAEVRALVLYSLKSKSKQFLTTQGIPVEWRNDTVILIAKQDKDGIVQHRHTIAAVDTKTQKETIIANNIAFPDYAANLD